MRTMDKTAFVENLSNWDARWLAILASYNARLIVGGFCPVDQDRTLIEDRLRGY